MSEPHIIVDREGSLGRIILNRPDARNPLDKNSSAGVLAGLRSHFADPAVRSVVISGAGDAFCAGGDLKQMAAFGEMSPVEAWSWPSAIVEAHKLMLAADKPVIAAVNGPASAGGMGLAGMCDIIVAVDGAKFAVPEVKVGLFPMIIVAHLARAIPRKILLEMMLTGDPIDAAEGHRLGFVNKVATDRDDMWRIVGDYARRFEKVAPTAVALGRRAFTLLSDMPASQALDAAQFFNLPFFFGDDMKEGATAFLEKRKPNWSPYGGDPE
ncbi:enoyl-CoA hydratase/isomerase family protein [Sphingomonas immobilis]|uniref:Enoyl-CoA hydratase-related protein n=1 Tax=Sphingomonas immobilis TaxID=3063997 RepID=A0ABT9A134_9SPHN|nr:enoyl-CoA hydratase-related protein [Sphingomonas sp. CA1-15]MDO7843167.1 enoyl-CoA hydratase-related protein [Sphingomonas sp. CA1-15]